MTGWKTSHFFIGNCPSSFMVDFPASHSLVFGEGMFNGIFHGSTLKNSRHVETKHSLVDSAAFKTWWVGCCIKTSKNNLNTFKNQRLNATLAMIPDINHCILRSRVLTKAFVYSMFFVGPQPLLEVAWYTCQDIFFLDVLTTYAIVAS